MLEVLAPAFTDPEHHQGAWMMVGALAAAASALIVLAAALVALYQLREAQKLRKDQTRPFVVIEFRVEATSLIYLRITNLGSTMAREVKFSVDPPLKTAGDRWDVMEVGIFRSGIKALAPGRVIEFLFDTWIGRDQINDRHEVKITYQDNEGAHYADEMDLDLGVYRDMHFTPRYGLHDVYKKLEEISSTLKDFKAFGGGLLRLSPADVKKRDEEWDHAVREHRAKTAEVSSETSSGSANTAETAKESEAGASGG
jgi:hypothetical protein